MVSVGLDWEEGSTDERRVMSETRPIAVTFFEVGQFMGLVGSFGPSQLTIFGCFDEFSGVAGSGR
jgi:hypothetical protein